MDLIFFEARAPVGPALPIATLPSSVVWTHPYDPRWSYMEAPGAMCKLLRVGTPDKFYDQIVVVKQGVALG